MELFRLEHKKLWRKKSVRISVIICILYTLVFAGILSYQWFSFGSQDDYTSAFGNNFDGYENIRSKQDYAKTFGEELSDETLQNIVRDYQKKNLSDVANKIEETDWKIVNSWLELLYPELKGTDDYQLMISYVNPDKLTNFEARRKEKVEEFLDNNGQGGAEKKYFMKMNSKVDAPLHYEWTEGWSQLLNDTIPGLGIIMALFISIAVSPIFSSEWHDNTSPVVLSTKNGWRKLAVAKVATGFAFSLELFTGLFIGNIVCQLIFMGTQGTEIPIQCIKLIAPAPMTVLQAEIYEYSYTLLGTIGFTGLVLLFSSKLKSNFTVLLASLSVVYIPMIISQYLPLWAQRYLELLPFVGDPTDVFRTNIFYIFGRLIWSPYLLISIPFIIGIVSVPFCVKNWAKRMKV